MSTHSHPAPTISRADLLRLLNDYESDNLLAWLKQHVPPYGVGDPIPLLPAALYTTSLVGRELKLLRGPANRLFQANVDNHARFVIYGRVDTLGTRWNALDTIFNVTKPIKGKSLNSFKYTLGLKSIDSNSTLFNNCWKDNRAGFGLASRTMTSAVSNFNLPLKRKLYGQSRIADKGAFLVVFPPVWRDTSNDFDSSEAPSPHKATGGPDDEGDNDEENDDEVFSAFNAGPPGTCYPASVIDEWEEGLFESDKVKAIQPPVFDEKGVPVHPADLPARLCVGTLVKVTVSLDMLLVRNDPVGEGPEKGLYGNTRLVELRILRYEEDGHASSDHSDAVEDNERVVPAEPTLHQDSLLGPSASSTFSSAAEGYPTRATSSTFTAISTAADGLPEMLRAVGGVLDHDIDMSDLSQVPVDANKKGKKRLNPHQAGRGDDLSDEGNPTGGRKSNKRGRLNENVEPAPPIKEKNKRKKM